MGLQENNEDITAGRSLPWLQDTEQEEVWTSWDVAYRDIYVLDSENYPVAIYNLSQNDLGNQANFQAVKDLLVGAAAFTAD